jgi:transposase
MDVREQRGREIAAKVRIEQRGGAWLVPSQSDNRVYRVTLDAGEIRCTCADFDLRHRPCKHVYAAAFVVQRQTTVTETTTVSGNEATTTTTVTETQTTAVRITYKQNWPAYNAAQTKEKALFCRLLHDLALGVPETVQEKGRPRIPMADAIFAACFKVYSTVSSRRFTTDLRDAHNNGLVSHPWHFNTVLGVIEDESLTPTLYDLVTVSAAPLGSVESTFAVDSTGFGTTQYYRHFTAKYGAEQEYRNFVKLHALVGTKTNVIAAAKVTHRNGADSLEFQPLIASGAQHFDLERVVADKAYGARKNIDFVESVGAQPIIPLSAAAKLDRNRLKASPAWAKLFHLYNYRQDEFFALYHARSNAESTFSSIKRVFGDTLRSKALASQTNELLLKVIAHNIVCLIHSMFELGIEMPTFRPCTQTGSAAQQVAG